MLVLAGPARAAPACFAAAARDPEHPCANPALRFAARPRLGTALLTPTYPCEGHGTIGDAESRIDGALFVCEFGTPADRATRTVALIGDSHAMAWRAAVAGALLRLGWRGIDLTRSHCAFNVDVRDLGDPEEVIGCVRFNIRAFRWLQAHPEVTAVVMAHQAGGTGYVAPSGLTPFRAETLGFQEAWAGLPDSVERVLAIRDNPANHNGYDVARCVRQARRARAAVGPFCARPRRQALHRDAFVRATRALDDPRYALLDLSDFFCSRRRCFPVVGGALVTKDGRHLTRTFSASLGPYLARAIRRAVSPYWLPAA